MRTIIDITQLAGWQGKLTGIPRVMYELSSRYANTDDETVFIGWDAGRQLFWELSFVELLEKRKQIDTLKLTEVNSRASLGSKYMLRTAFNRSPRLLKAVARHLRAVVQSSQQQTIPDMGFKFRENDNLIILWGEWGDTNYRQTIVNAVIMSKVNLYQFVYDMLPLVTPQYSAHSTEGLRLYVEEIYPLCQRLISISEHTKKDVQQWLEDRTLVVPQIETVRLGENFEKLSPSKPRHPFFNSNVPYIVCVGTVETRKNHTLLYYVYKLAKTRHINLPPIVVVGRRGWMTENIYDLITSDPETKDMFIFLHDASDEELSWTYDHSLFSIYPSHYEGWGLPVAESIAHGTPSVSSNTSSMPEIAGDLISYFTPTSTDECLEAIVYLLDEQHLADAKNRIKSYTPTSWDETFIQTQRIIGERND